MIIGQIVFSGVTINSILGWERVEIQREPLTISLVMLLRPQSYAGESPVLMV